MTELDDELAQKFFDEDGGNFEEYQEAVMGNYLMKHRLDPN